MSVACLRETLGLSQTCSVQLLTLVRYLSKSYPLGLQHAKALVVAFVSDTVNVLTSVKFVTEPYYNSLQATMAPVLLQ